MYRMMPQLRTAAFAASLLVCASGAVSGAETVPATQKAQAGSNQQDLVARVNGVGITASQLKRALASLKETQPDVKLSPETQKIVAANVLKDLVSQELLYQAGLKLEIKDLDNLVKEEVSQVQAKFVSDAFFQKALAERGETEADLFENARRKVVVNNFVAKTIDAKVSVTDEECKKVYDANIDKLTTPETIRMSQILIPVTPDMTAAQKKHARAQAEEIRQQLLKGAGFIELVDKYSAAPSKKQGGDLGYLSRQELPGPLAKAAFALQPGQLSGIVESRAGYDILKIRDRRSAVITPFDQARPEIEAFLKKLKSETALQAFLKAEHEKAKVELLLK